MKIVDLLEEVAAALARTGWEGTWGALIAAVVSALVAFLVVRLGKRHERQLWTEQRRLESFASVLEAWNRCWVITTYNWNRYDSGEEPSGELDTDRIQRTRDAELSKAEESLRGRLSVWRLYLDSSCDAIEEAVDRALRVLTMEWLYRSHAPRGHLWIPMPEEIGSEWEEFANLTRKWHGASGRARRRAGAGLRKLWMMTPKTYEDVITDFGHARGFTVD